MHEQRPHRWPSHLSSVLPVTVAAIVPIRSFTGLTRLSAVLDEGERASLMKRLATHTVSAVRAAGLQMLIVSNDPDVTSWSAACGCTAIPEPDAAGLNGAAAAGVAEVGGGPWMVVHADLPAVTANDILAGARLAERGYVFAPSHDGGTSLIGGTGTGFPYRYGPGSFRRHLAAVRGEAAILVRPGLALDLDHPRDLNVLRRLGYL
ncbi:MAG: 2-phospho-L-lactate guanylyltransferase [Actinomycetota bacterium]|nr:2-phospho-L-lactate guanylyltransferase [Actinomycetota bacterium]